jgi:Protein of unknown function (DUF3007)
VLDSHQFLQFLQVCVFYTCTGYVLANRLHSDVFLGVEVLVLPPVPTDGCVAGLVVVTEPRRRWCIAASAEKKQDERAVNYNKEFGYSRKDVVLIGVGLVALGYALYYGIQAAGVDPLMAGNFTQLIIILGLCIVWVGSYVFRVMNKVCPPSPISKCSACGTKDMF